MCGRSSDRSGPIHLSDFKASWSVSTWSQVIVLSWGSLNIQVILVNSVSNRYVSGDISKHETHVLPKPCGIAHPGLCQTRDHLLFPYIRPLLTCFHKTVLQGEEGTWFKLEAKLGDVAYYSTYLFLVHRRCRDPKVALFCEGLRMASQRGLVKGWSSLDSRVALYCSPIVH